VLHKAVVSRSAALLRERQLVVIERDAGIQRLYLTRAGAEMHDQIMEIATHLQEELMEGFTAGERTQLTSLLLRLLDNSPRLHRYETAMTREENPE
jgi:DNA-binding MarR family transcriptional regulator